MELGLLLHVFINGCPFINHIPLLNEQSQVWGKMRLRLRWGWMVRRRLLKKMLLRIGGEDLRRRHGGGGGVRYSTVASMDSKRWCWKKWLLLVNNRSRLRPVRPHCRHMRGCHVRWCQLSWCKMRWCQMRLRWYHIRLRWCKMRLRRWRR